MWSLEVIVSLNDAVVRAAREDKTIVQAYNEVGLHCPLPQNTEPRKLGYTLAEKEGLVGTW